MKSDESTLLDLAFNLFFDVDAMCANDLTRDFLTLKSRTKHEGISFLTITLPNFGDDFFLSLELGFIDSTFFRSFKKNGSIPAFLQGMVSQCFDSDGRILDEPKPEAIQGIRQIAYFYKKVKLPCTAGRKNSAFTAFIKDEQIFNNELAVADRDDFTLVSNVLWSNVLGREFSYELSIPRHGPGATGEKLSGNAKFTSVRWHERLEQYFPLFHTRFHNENVYMEEEFQKLVVVPECDEQPVRVIAVPKTLKKPRIIAIEPVCMQYTQQLVSRWLVNHLESSPLTKGHINFRDQTVNQRLAMMASIDKSNSTLDLSAASDRVPLSLIKDMLGCNQELLGSILACRSTRAELPDGAIVHLRKFASMGSALCFPIESMYFYTICIVALLRQQNLSPTFLNIRRMSRKVYVYGDDLIVPTDAFAVVSETLQKYYCKVNVTKSYENSYFRESCGLDAFRGVDVTPVYLRAMPPRNKRSASELISTVSTCNQLYKKGYWRTSDYLRKVVEKQLGALPIVGENCAGLGLHTYQKTNYISCQSRYRWSKRYQKAEILAYCAKEIKTSDPLDGYEALLKCLITPLQEDKEHLRRTVRRGAVTLKRRWLSPV